MSPGLTADISWMVLPSPLSSDHYPILVEIDNGGRGENSYQDNFNHYKGRLTAISSDPMWQCIPDVGSDPGIAMDKLYGILDELRNKHIPKFKRRRFFPKPCWSQGCGEAWKRREECYRTYKSTGNIDDKINWKRARARATKT